MFDYTSLQKTAINQIKDKGRDVLLKYKNSGTYNPVSDSIVSTSTNQTVKMLITNFKKSEYDGTLIKRGDFLGLLAPDNLTQEPEQQDTVTDDSETYTVVNIEKIHPGDIVLLYKLQLRQV